MISTQVVETIRHKYQLISPYLNEKSRRVWGAIEAQSLGYGGISAVSQASGLNRNTIKAGFRDLKEQEKPEESSCPHSRIRETGGGRKRLEEKDLTLLADLDMLLEPTTRGDPESPLRWTCKSVKNLAKALQPIGHSLSPRSVYNLLKSMGYSLQSNRKTQEGTAHPDRDRQFHYISRQVSQFQKSHRPVISVDAKKRELIGNYKQPGQEWHPKGKPTEVKMHDFEDQESGKAIPYGVYDLSANEGWVSVGIDHNTAEFAIESIRHWWDEMGHPRYPHSKHLLITADCGSSNSNRSRLWKFKLQKLANETGLTIHVCHFPPGTSKWNKIEHRLFCHITKNWRGRPLTSLEVVVNLISNTTTDEGLDVRAQLDENSYPVGIKVTDEQFKEISIKKRRFHGEWNYQINPQRIMIA
jgi:transposase